MIGFKMDVLQELKKHGYTTYRLRKERILGEATVQKLRKSELVSWDNINTICGLLDCQPGDLMEFKKDLDI